MLIVVNNSGSGNSSLSIALTKTWFVLKADRKIFDCYLCARMLAIVWVSDENKLS